MQELYGQLYDISCSKSFRVPEARYKTFFLPYRKKVVLLHPQTLNDTIMTGEIMSNQTLVDIKKHRRLQNQVNYQCKAGKLKTGVLAVLLGLSPLSAKAQYVHHGEKVLARDTVELFGKQKAEALLIDNDGNPNNFERFAISTLRQFKSKHRNLKGEEGYMKEWTTQYVDTLIKVFTRVEGTNEETVRYYVAGPQIQRNVLFRSSDDKVVSYFIFRDVKPVSGVFEVPHNRMEVPEKTFNEFVDFLKPGEIKEEHVVRGNETFEDILYGL